MISVRRHLILKLFLCAQLSVCLLGSINPSTSLWGKKLHFKVRPCLWQLQQGILVHPLKELSVCMHLRREYAAEWTGFVYKAPGRRRIELGLGGKFAQMIVWMFGKEFRINKELKLKEWYSICLTWSGQAQELHVYVNETSLSEKIMNRTEPQQLAPNGTLTLGMSHYVDKNNKVQGESGTNLLGEIGLFRMWAKALSVEELSRQRCAVGDVISWDQQNWQHDCPPEPDISLHCEWPSYKIKMQLFIANTDIITEECSVSLETITREWLHSIFPPNISITRIIVASSSLSCHFANLHVQSSQESRASLNSSCVKCFYCEVHVNVSPAARMDLVQISITAMLNSTFPFNGFNLTVDPNNMSILPVELFSGVTPPTPSPVVTSPDRGTTNSLPGWLTNMSTTEEPLDLNKTSVGPDTFLRVNVTLNMTANTTGPKEIIEYWLKDRLQVKNTIILLNVIITERVWRSMEQYIGLMIFQHQVRQYDCTFHVQVYDRNNITEITSFVDAALSSPHKNGSIIIKTMYVTIKHIVPENCLEEMVSTIHGDYIWPETFPQVNQEMGCIKPMSNRGFRFCKLQIETDTTRWADPDMSNCNPILTISDLQNITVTPDNMAEVVDMIQDLVNVELGNSAELSSSELDTVMDKLDKVVGISTIEPSVGASTINIVADILLSKSNVSPLANDILNMTERLGSNLDLQGESVSLTAPSMALYLIDVDPERFSGLTFSVSSISSVQRPEVFLNQSFISEPFHDKDAMISIPSELLHYFPPGENKSRVQFQFYGTHDLFQDPSLANAEHSSLTLKSYIVSASLNSRVSNLKHKVVVTLSHEQLKQPNDKVRCVFWDFHKNGGHGGWSSRGCKTQGISSHQTSCHCDHLTHFALLLDVSRTPISNSDSQILTVISYVGCGVSSIFLGITLLTYLAFEKLRQDHPSKILINLSAALLGLSMLFLLDAWLSSFSNHSLCIATAASLHYFLLASFTWMGLEAVHMYLALVKVFTVYVPSYILKLCAVGWGIPLLIVSLVLAIDKDAYGKTVYKTVAVTQDTDPFCWLLNDVFFYVTVVAFVLFILLCNFSVFIVVLIQIRHMKTNKSSANNHPSLHSLRAVASLTVLLGLTWSMGFFSFGPGKTIMMYLFSICNTLQGFFVFVFHCLMKENVRKQWRTYLCCGPFRLNAHSDWSQSLTGGCRRKKNHLVDSEFSNNTSTVRKASDSTAGSGPNHHKGA